MALSRSALLNITCSTSSIMLSSSSLSTCIGFLKEILLVLSSWKAFSLRVPTENLLHLHLRDLVVVIGAVAVVIHEAEGAHIDLEFLGVDHSHRFVDVEENEGLIRKIVGTEKGRRAKEEQPGPAMHAGLLHTPT